MNKTIYETFADSVMKNSNRTAMMYKKERQYQGITYAELRDAVNAVAAALQKLGIKKGDTIAIVSYNRPEWAIADLAIMKSGGMVVPIYCMPGHPLACAYVKYVLKDAKVSLIFIENAEMFSVVKPFIDEIPSIKYIVLFDYIGIEDKSCIKFSDLKQTDPRSFKEVTDLSADDVATIVYTSGTTGEPKGVMLTHSNVLFIAHSAIERYHFTPDDVVISYLPLAHIFERTCDYYTVIFAGGCIGYAESFTTTLAQDAEEIKPTILLSVPRILEKAFELAVEKVQGSSPFKKKLVAAAIQNLNEYKNREYRKQPISLWLKIKCKIYDLLVASKFRKLGGGRIRLIVTGGAPMNRQIAKIIYNLGFNIVEGYGLTETSPVVACSPVEDNRLGTVGKPFAGVEVRIGDDHEILVRGPNIMKGYFNKSNETARAIDKDGWFHTGDQGKFDEYGNLVITGRIKELIVTSGGKNIAPAPIEARISACPYIEQVMLYGDKKKYLVGLIVPSRETVELYAEEKNISYDTYPTLLEHNEIKNLITHEIKETISVLASYQQPKAFAIINEAFTIENEMLTAKLEMKRKKVIERYGKLLDTIYSTAELKNVIRI